MQVTDIAEVSQLCKELGLLLIVDNTFNALFSEASGYGRRRASQRDEVPCGHNDTLAGFWSYLT